MFYKLRYLGDPILYQRSNQVLNYHNLENLIETMFMIMNKYHGVGLAANQIGVDKRIFTYKYNSESNYFINPEIISKSNKLQTSSEGCLSIPLFYSKISRPDNLTIKGYDLTGKEQIKEANGFLARIFSHELDHLNGTLYIDKLDLEKRYNIIKKYKANN
jgi:peptide deformylase